MKKYYYVSYYYRYSGMDGALSGMLIDIHPLDWLIAMRSKTEWVYTIVSWNEISEDEYNRCSKILN